MYKHNQIIHTICTYERIHAFYNKNLTIWKEKTTKGKILITWALIRASFDAMKGPLGFTTSPTLLHDLFELLEANTRELLLLALHILLIGLAELHLYIETWRNNEKSLREEKIK